MLTKDDLQKIATLIQPLQEGQERLEKKLKKQGKDMNYIKKTLDVAINMFDQEIS